MSEKVKKPKQALTASEQQMIQEEKDKQMAPKLEGAFNKSLTNTVPAPAAPEAKKMAGGGVTRADGCISKGRTKGKMIVMAGGGMC
jgi:hypothetical protein